MVKEPGVSKLSGRDAPGQIFVKIADITMELIGDDPGMILCLEGAMNRFRIDKGHPDVRIRAGWGELAEDPAGRKIFDSGGLWRLYLNNGYYRFELTSPAVGKLPYTVALFNPDFTSGEVRLRPAFFSTHEPVYPLQHPLDELLMLNLLAKGKGVQVHACGVVDPTGRGYLFAGQSGAGKTTMARLWEKHAGVKILSDDRIILRQLDGKFWMYGTPWHGEAKFASSARAPLNQIFFLRHGQENERLPRAGAEAAALLFSCMFPTFYSPDGLDFSLAFSEAVNQSVACQELRFVPDQRVLQFIQANPS